MYWIMQWGEYYQWNVMIEGGDQLSELQTMNSILFSHFIFIF